MKVTLYNKSKKEVSCGHYISFAGMKAAGPSWNMDHTEENERAVYFSIDDGSLKLVSTPN